MTETQNKPNTPDRHVEISVDGGKNWKPLATNSVGFQKLTYLRSGDKFRMYLPDKSKKVTLKGQHELTVNRGGYVGCLGIVSVGIEGFPDPLEVARGEPFKPVTPKESAPVKRNEDAPGTKAKVS